MEFIRELKAEISRCVVLNSALICARNMTHLKTRLFHRLQLLQATGSEIQASLADVTSERDRAFAELSDIRRMFDMRRREEGQAVSLGVSERVRAWMKDNDATVCVCVCPFVITSVLRVDL